MPLIPQDATDSTAVSDADRRKEERHFICFGRPVYITWLQEQSLLGNLIEVSRSGFRMTHQYRHFDVGQEVRVSFPWGQVRARVAWTKAGRRSVQTGFAVLEGSAEGTSCPK